MTYFTGLDVSLRSVSICIIDEQGVIKYEAKVATKVDRIVACLREFSHEVIAVAFEVGALTQYLTYGLQAAGFEPICMEARQVAAALSAMRNKTDRNDARGIAQILRTGSIAGYTSRVWRAITSGSCSPAAGPYWRGVLIWRTNCAGCSRSSVDANGQERNNCRYSPLVEREQSNRAPRPSQMCTGCSPSMLGFSASCFLRSQASAGQTSWPWLAQALYGCRALP